MCQLGRYGNLSKYRQGREKDQMKSDDCEGSRRALIHALQRSFIKPYTIVQQNPTQEQLAPTSMRGYLELRFGCWDVQELPSWLGPGVGLYKCCPSGYNWT